MPKNSPSVAPALDRGLAIVESLAQTTEPLTLTQIAQRLELSVSEIQRVVNVLRERRYLVRDSQGAYRISSKLYRLATAYPPYSDLAARATGAMQRYSNETSESIHVGVLTDFELLIVATVEGRGLVRVNLQLGALQVATATVSGRILLAYSDPEIVQSLAQHTGLTKAATTRLRKELTRIKQRGYEHSKSEAVEGIEDLGVPILTPDNQIIAGLTTTWLPFKGRGSRVKALLPALQETARQIATNYE